MTCSQAKTIINNWELTALTPPEKELFFQHIDKCTDCHKLYTQTKKTIEIIDKATQPLEVPAIPEHFIHIVKSPQLHQRQKHSWTNYFKYTAIAASFIIIIFAATIIIPRLIPGNQETEVNQVNEVLYQISENQLSDINDQYQQQIAFEDELYSAESLYFSQEDIYFLVSSLNDDELEAFNDLLTTNYPDMITMGGI
ncbi:MAG: hypothetical protein ACP5FK_01255 [bacterium]